MPYFQNINLDKKIRAYAPKNKKDYIFNRHNLFLTALVNLVIAPHLLVEVHRSFSFSLIGGDSPIFIIL